MTADGQRQAFGPRMIEVADSVQDKALRVCQKLRDIRHGLSGDGPQPVAGAKEADAIPEALGPGMVYRLQAADRDLIEAVEIAGRIAAEVMGADTPEKYPE